MATCIAQSVHSTYYRRIGGAPLKVRSNFGFDIRNIARVIN